MNLTKKQTQHYAKIITVLIIFMILSIISVYFTHIHNHGLMDGDDLQFHKDRIEGLYEALKNKDFFPKLNMLFMNTMGYASSIFYSDLFLYYPALLRIIGFSVSETYVLFVISINFITFLLAYFSFYNFSLKHKNSFIFSLLYTLSTYRLLDITRRGSLGEVLAMTFLPLAFLGLFHILYKNPKKWYFLSLGMALIIYAHILSGVMLTLVIFLFLLKNYKKLLFDKSRLFSLFKAICMTVLLVIAYFLPVIEQTISQPFKVGNAPTVFISEKAKQLGDVFTNSLTNSAAPNIGLILLVFLIIYLFSVKKIKTSHDQDIFFIAIFVLLLTTNLIPWKIVENTFLNTIQFPWRFFAFATLLLCWVIAEDSLNIFKNHTITTLVLILSVLFSISYTLNLRYQTDEDKIMTYHEFNKIDSTKIGSGFEYLPANSDYYKLIDREIELIYDSSEVAIKGYEKNRDKVTFNFDSTNKETVTVPLIYYKGYTAEFSGDGKGSQPFLNEKEEGLAAVEVEGAGSVTVYYKQTLIQKVSLLISIVSWLGLLLYLIYTNKIKNTH